MLEPFQSVDVPGRYRRLLGNKRLRRVGDRSRNPSRPPLLAQYRFLGTYDSASVRRGFQVFAKNCGNCHGMIYKKYDVVLDKAYSQMELAVPYLKLEHCESVFNEPRPPPLQTVLLLGVGGQRPSDPRQTPLTTLRTRLKMPREGCGRLISLKSD